MKTRLSLSILSALMAFGCWGPGSNNPSCFTPQPGYILVNRDAIFVANTGSNSISAFQSVDFVPGYSEGGVCGSPFAVSAPPTALGGASSTPSSEIFDLIVLSAPEKTISLFNVDFVTSVLTGPVATVTTPYTPVAVAVWEYFFYVANAEGSVSAYQVSGKGAVVTELAGSPFPAGSGPVAIAAAEPGLLYVANSQSNNVSAYTLNPNTGVPTPLSGSPFPAGTTPSSIEVAPPTYPNGFGATLVIVTNARSNNVSVYSVSGAGGLTPVSGSPFAAGAAPSSSATGNYLPLRWVYVANSQSNNISGYSINDASGVLTPLASSPFPAGEQPLSVAVSVAAQFLYAANNGSNSLSVYSIDQSSGALTPVSGSPFPVGQSPGAVLYFQVPD
jgi:6-phosphogluconolactonase (cycloisomerase 2 family)